MRLRYYTVFMETLYDETVYQKHCCLGEYWDRMGGTRTGLERQ